MSVKYRIKGIVKRVVPRKVLRNVARPLLVAGLNVVYGARGYEINIGGQGGFRLAPDMAFAGWERFGDRHNSGFARCIDACRGKQVFFDVGAHIGLYSLPAARAMAPGGRVFSFEPAANNLAYLRRHIAYNGLQNVTVVDAVVADADANDVVFYEHEGKSSPVSGIVQRGRPGDRYLERRMRQVTLDSFCAEAGLIPDVLKIDVEGAEVAVLRGARSVLDHGPTVFLSVHPGPIRALGHSLDELHHVLRGAGYTIHAADGTTVEHLTSGEHICTPPDKSLPEVQPA